MRYVQQDMTDINILHRLQYIYFIFLFYQFAEVFGQHFQYQYNMIS